MLLSTETTFVVTILPDPPVCSNCIPATIPAVLANVTVVESAVNVAVRFEFREGEFFPSLNVLNERPNVELE